MIDGIDVSECIFYQTNFKEDFDVKIKHFCSNWYNSCESVNNSNCYFKQLSRKTQECEELEKQLTDFMNGEYCANGCAKMQTQYKEYHTKLITDKNKAEQKLKRIKEIAENRSNYPCGKCIKGKILQIIDEVE